jgi:hypothetical protein
MTSNSDPGVFGILSVKVQEWSGDAQPDEAACRSLVETQGVAGADGVVAVKPGSVVCAVSGDGRTARLEVISVPTTDDAVIVRATVWEAP